MLTMLYLLLRFLNVRLSNYVYVFTPFFSSVFRFLFASFRSLVPSLRSLFSGLEIILPLLLHATFSCMGIKSRAATAYSVERLGYGLEGLGFESRWGQNFPCSPDRSRGQPTLLYHGYWLCGPTSLPFSGHQSYFPEIKRPGREATHSPSFNAEDKNNRSCIPPPRTCFQGVNWEKFSLVFFIGGAAIAPSV